ncbi:MAG: hypothetical protein K8T10_20515 [Candidatus Eremiobacteraeota bacterium]|nr:hypothetical protein [Candidatus Eremiobacteraeota bacterium]
MFAVSFDAIADKIVARIAGPLSFRFILQPLAAIALGIRDGLLDVKSGSPPYIIDLIFKSENRKRNILNGLKTLLKPVIISIILDILAQYLIFKQINLFDAAIVGIFIMGIPYSLARGIINRIVTAKDKMMKEENQKNLADTVKK